jgi:hypothetical protein
MKQEKVRTLGLKIAERMTKWRTDQICFPAELVDKYNAKGA